MVKKLTKYALEEVKMAEHYIHLAKTCTEESTALKFQEIAKDEMRHYQFLNDLIHKKLSEKTEDGVVDTKSVPEKHGAILHHMYEEWADKVKTEIEIFKVK